MFVSLLLPLLAQASSEVAQTDAIAGLLTMSFKDFQLNGLTLLVVFKLLGELLSAIRKGGGLRRIIYSVWSGENIPAPIAADYQKELSRAPFPKPNEKDTQ